MTKHPRRRAAPSTFTPRATFTLCLTLGLLITLVLIVLYVGSYAVLRHTRYADWQRGRQHWDIPAITYYHDDIRLRLLYRPLMYLDEQLTDIRYMYIPPSEEK